MAPASGVQYLLWSSIMPVKVKRRTRHKALDWATVDVDNPEEVAELHRLEQRRAGRHIKKAVAQLQALGIIDREGRLLKKELPPDTQEGSSCDL
jgi:hypothetical protein